MHEMSLCESVLQIVQDSARSHGFNKVKTVWLEIGDLAGVEVDAMRFSFDVVCKQTLAAEAKLEIIRLPGLAWCLPCAKTIAIQQRFDPCPHCGSHQLQISQGEEMRIKELEVE